MRQSAERLASFVFDHQIKLASLVRQSSIVKADILQTIQGNGAPRQKVAARIGLKRPNDAALRHTSSQRRQEVAEKYPSLYNVTRSAAIDDEFHCQWLMDLTSQNHLSCRTVLRRDIDSIDAETINCRMVFTLIEHL